MNLAELRDLIIVVFGITGIVTLFVVLVVTMVVGLAARGLISTLKTTVQEDLTPILNSVKQSTDNIKGTTAFVADTAVGPIVRAYSILAGIRRAAGVITGLAGRRRSKG